jgi:hypothetical protein
MPSHPAPMAWPWVVAFRTAYCCLAGEWQGNGMAGVNQTRPHCVNQMGKSQTKPLVEWHSRGMAWERHSMCELGLTFWHQNFILNILYIKCKNIEPKKGNIIK